MCKGDFSSEDDGPHSYMTGCCGRRSYTYQYCNGYYVVCCACAKTSARGACSACKPGIEGTEKARKRKAAEQADKDLEKEEAKASAGRQNRINQLELSIWLDSLQDLRPQARGALHDFFVREDLVKISLIRMHKFEDLVQLPGLNTLTLGTKMLLKVALRNLQVIVSSIFLPPSFMISLLFITLILMRLNRNLQIC